MTDRERITRILAADAWRMEALSAVATLEQPSLWIGAGFVRNAVWDHLHGFAEATPLNDIDAIYFDLENRAPARDKALEARLTTILPAAWSVANQARMHERNCDAPYASVEDALRYWPETATAIAVRIGTCGMEILAPFGLDDVFAMTVRPTPHARESRPRTYRDRIAAKNWQRIWPKVKIIEV